MDYFISDTHFGHKSIISYDRTNFNTVEEHDRAIIKKIESLHLTDEDRLFHLGDFGGMSTEIEFIWEGLKGEKILILGNHDVSKNYYLPYFDKVYETPMYYKNRVILSHIPVMTSRGVINIHGHLHGGILSLPNYYNVNIYDNKKILTSKGLLKILNKVPRDNSQFMREWYAQYYRKNR